MFNCTHCSTPNAQPVDHETYRCKSYSNYYTELERAIDHTRDILADLKMHHPTVDFDEVLAWL